MGYRFRLRKPMHVQGRWAFEETLVLLGAGSTRLFGYINWIENVSCCNLSWKMIMTLPIRVNDQTHTKPPRRWRSTLQSDEYPLFDTVWPLLRPFEKAWLHLWIKKTKSCTVDFAIPLWVVQSGKRNLAYRESLFHYVCLQGDHQRNPMTMCNLKEKLHLWEDHTMLWRSERNQNSELWKHFTSHIIQIRAAKSSSIRFLLC